MRCESVGDTSSACWEAPNNKQLCQLRGETASAACMHACMRPMGFARVQSVCAVCVFCGCLCRARLVVEVSGHQDRQAASSGFDFETSSNEFISAETREKNIAAATEAEAAFQSLYVEPDEDEDEDLCGLQNSYLDTTTAADLLSGDTKPKPQSTPNPKP